MARRLARHLAHRRWHAPAGYDLQLTRYGDEGWRATFFLAVMAHSLTAAVASAWTRAPWTAVQRAARNALRKREAGGFLFGRRRIFGRRLS